jgi:hypothetical protein
MYARVAEDVTEENLKGEGTTAAQCDVLGRPEFKESALPPTLEPQAS